jgi:hypothetical protein
VGFESCGLEVGSCEHGNEPSGLMKGGECIDCTTFTVSRNILPCRGIYGYASTVLFSFFVVFSCVISCNILISCGKCVNFGDVSEILHCMC